MPNASNDVAIVLSLNHPITSRSHQQPPKSLKDQWALVRALDASKKDNWLSNPVAENENEMLVEAERTLVESKRL